MVDFRMGATIDPKGAVDGLNLIERRLFGIQKTAQDVFRTLGAALSLRSIGDQLDQYTSLQNRLNAVAGANENVEETTIALTNVANRARTSVSSVIQVYSRLAISLRTLGLTQAEAIDVTETLAKTIAISGSSTYEANGALIQFSQAIAAAALRGDELRSVLEQFPELANTIAKRFGVTGPELAKLGERGIITSRQIVKALFDDRKNIDERFGRTVATIAQSFQVLKNVILVTAGEFNKSFGITKKFTDGVIFLAKNIDVLIKFIENLAIVLGPGLLIRTLTTLATAIASNPFITLGLAVAAAATAFPKLNEALVEFSNRIFGAFGGLDKIVSALQKIGEYIVSGFVSVLNLVAGRLDLVNGAATGLAVAFGVKLTAAVLGKLVPALTTSLIPALVRSFTLFVAYLDLLLFKGVGAVVKVARAHIALATATVSAATKITALSAALGALVFVMIEIRDLIKEVEETTKNLDMDGVVNGFGARAGNQIRNFSKELKQLNEQIAAAEKRGVAASEAQKARQAFLEKEIGLQKEIAKIQTGTKQAPPAENKIDKNLFKDRVDVGPGPNIEAPDLGVARKKNPFIEELESLQQIILVEQTRIALGNEAAELEQTRLDLLYEGVDLSTMELQILGQLQQARRDTEAVAQAEQQLDVNQQLIEQERILNLLLAERPDLADSLRSATLSAKIAALETSTALEDGFERAFLKLQQEAENLAAVGEQVVNAFADGITNTLVTALQKGEFSFKEFASSILDEITKILVRLLVVQLITAAIGGGGAAPLVGAAAGGFGSGQVGGGGRRARGGTVQPDRSYIVGEEGPELFRPRTTGTIVPNPGAPAPAPQVNLSVVNVDDPKAVPSAINKGISDEAIVNVLARNRDRIKQVLG